MDEFDFFDNFEKELEEQIVEKVENYDFLNYSNIIKKKTIKKISYLEKNSPFESLNKIFPKKIKKKSQEKKNINVFEKNEFSENSDFDIIKKYESHIKSKNISKK